MARMFDDMAAVGALKHGEGQVSLFLIDIVKSDKSFPLQP